MCHIFIWAVSGNLWRLDNRTMQCLFNVLFCSVLFCSLGTRQISGLSFPSSRAANISQLKHAQNIGYVVVQVRCFPMQIFSCTFEMQKWYTMLCQANTRSTQQQQKSQRMSAAIVCDWLGPGHLMQENAIQTKIHGSISFIGQLLSMFLHRIDIQLKQGEQSWTKKNIKIHGIA